MTWHSPGQVIAELITAAVLQTETIHQRIVLAWGQALFAELGRVWAQLDTEDTLAYEDKRGARACARGRHRQPRVAV
jgi:hypothetical protein